MKRVALYARYSTDLQNDRSIDDQLALCRAYAARHDLAIVAEFNDRAISGASIQNRPGIKTLMAAAQAGGFDVVLVEQLDRVSRDQVDLPAVWRDLRHAGVELVAVHGGEADVVQIGVRALVGALFLQDLADKVRRGLAGVAREGRSAGGISYGYRQVAGGRRGEREIDPDQAAIVRRIAREYTAGRTPREIAAGLNRDQVPPPRDGGRWNGSTIYGSPKRGTGILHNELYAGRLVWNRLRMVRDPNTGRRISRINPASEHQVVAVPHLAILDDRTWQDLRACFTARANAPQTVTRRAPRLLSGLLRCGACGGGMTAYGNNGSGRARLHCSRHRESGTCDHRRLYFADEIEQITLDGLRANLRDPSLIKAYVREYQEERRRLAGSQAAARTTLERRLSEAQAEGKRLVDAIAKGRATIDLVHDRLAELQSEIRAAEDQLAQLEPDDRKVVALHPQAVRLYLAQVERLAAELQTAGQPAEDQAESAAIAAKSIRDLVREVVVHPVATPEIDVEIRGRLAVLVAHPEMPPSGRLRRMGTSGSGGRI